MKGFKNIYSLANIAACLKDTKVYATPLQTTTNYMRCYATIDQAKNEWAYLLATIAMTKRLLLETKLQRQKNYK